MIIINIDKPSGIVQGKLFKQIVVLTLILKVRSVF